MEREGDMNAFPIEDMGKTDLDKDRLYRVFGDSVQYHWQEIPDVSMYLLLLQINYKSLTAIINCKSRKKRLQVIYRYRII